MKPVWVFLLLLNGALAVIMGVIASITAFYLPGVVADFVREPEDTYALATLASISASGVAAGGGNCVNLFRQRRPTSKLGERFFHLSNLVFISVAMLVSLAQIFMTDRLGFAETYGPGLIALMFLATYLFLRSAAPASPAQQL